MADLLERVSTIHQTSLGVTRLPLELQQQVFSYLDARSFNAARNVCRWWRFATLDAITLARQLKKLPILPTASATQSAPQQLQRLWNEAAYTLMLGVQVQRLPDLHESAVSRQDMRSPPGGIFTSNGARTVTVTDRTIALYDTSGEEARVMAQRPLNDLKETVGSGPWLRVTPASEYELALSSDGSLLAIAQERTIQIYDLSAEPDSFTVNEYISSATGNFICGLSFEQNDRMLRVQLSGKSAVLYLGSPSTNAETLQPTLIDHWKSKAGLKHIFLDSVLLAPVVSQAGSTVRAARFSGLQLLEPFHNGYLFAAQQHGGEQSSHYVLGYVRCSDINNTRPTTVEPESLTVLARLESFLSAWDYTLNGANESGLGLWENMPSAHEHHPSFRLSPDGTMLVLAERDKKRVRVMTTTQLFAYRLPSQRSLMRMLMKREESGKWASLNTFLDKLEHQQSSDGDVTMVDRQSEGKHTVGRIPICLSTVRGAVTELRFDEVESTRGEEIVLSATTEKEGMKRWSFAEMV